MEQSEDKDKEKKFIGSALTMIATGASVYSSHYFDAIYCKLIFILIYSLIGYLLINLMLKYPSLRKPILIILIANGFAFVGSEISLMLYKIILFYILLLALIFILRHPVHEFKLSQIDEFGFKYLIIGPSICFLIILLIHNLIFIILKLYFVEYIL